MEELIMAIKELPWYIVVLKTWWIWLPILAMIVLCILEYVDNKKEDY